MPVVLVYVVLALTPAAALVAAGRGLERWCRWSPPRRRSRPSVRGAGAVPGAGSSLQRLVADLRRLEADYRRIAVSDLPGRVGRLRSVAQAYDERLRDCCGALGLPEPAVPLSSLDRLHTEAALAQQGVRW